MCRDLKPILSEANILYLASHFHDFKMEFQYWQQCGKLQRILLYESENVDLKPVPVDYEFVCSKNNFLNVTCAFEQRWPLIKSTPRIFQGKSSLKFNVIPQCFLSSGGKLTFLLFVPISLTAFLSSCKTKTF